MIPLKPFEGGLVQPLRGAWGWDTLGQKNRAAGGENGSIMMGMCVSLWLASQKPSEREFFIPAGMDLAVTSEA